MAIQIDSVEILKAYISGVLERSNDHAQRVEGVSLALIGAVIWRSTGRIEVRQYGGTPANVLWFEVGSNRYAFVYNHSTESIELKSRTINGETLATFNNSTDLGIILNFFRAL